MYTIDPVTFDELMRDERYRDIESHYAVARAIIEDNPQWESMAWNSLGERVKRWRARQPGLEEVAKGDSHMSHARSGSAPPGFAIKGGSYLIKDGKVRLHWLKTKPDEVAQWEAFKEAIDGLTEPFKGAARPLRAPSETDPGLLTVYPMGDPHIGMLSWHLETGEDFDLQIAEETLVGAVDHLVHLAPKSGRALILNLGDFFHSDDQSNRTRGSGHSLDVDGRWSKVLRVGLRAMRRCVDRALRKHAVVEVWNVIGNHDSHSASMLSMCLDALYEREPRVLVNTSPSPFYYLRHGQCLIGATHGDGPRMEHLGELMAADRPEDWGQTKHRHWYTGHIHHDSAKETRGGVLVESFRTLAAKDAWTNAQGYRAGRDMKLDVWHAEHGRINRHIVGIEQLRDK